MLDWGSPYEFFRDALGEFHELLGRMARYSNRITECQREALLLRTGNPKLPWTTLAMGTSVSPKSLKDAYERGMEGVAKEWMGFLRPMAACGRALRRELITREFHGDYGERTDTVYWVSRHPLMPSQEEAIRDIHGYVGKIERKEVSFGLDPEALSNFLVRKQRGERCFIYVVASSHHVLTAALNGLSFGVMVNHPQKREDGTFEVAAVYHVRDCRIEKVWPVKKEGDADH